MKLTTTTQVSVDGVMQGNGGASDENRIPKGVTIQVYRPAGRPQYATATADLST